MLNWSPKKVGNGNTSGVKHLEDLIEELFEFLGEFGAGNSLEGGAYSFDVAQVAARNFAEYHPVVNSKDSSNQNMAEFGDEHLLALDDEVDDECSFERYALFSELKDRVRLKSFNSNFRWSS